MKSFTSRGMFRSSLGLLLVSCLAVSAVTVGDARTDAGGGGGGGKRSTALFLLTGYKPKVAPKAAEVVEDVDDPPAVAELPPKPLPQTMWPRSAAADALKPPLGAARVAPPPRQLVDVDVCRGHYDVTGHFDATFNCSKGSYIYCCGTCHFRFCCEHQRSRLDQESCNNYVSPVWAEPLGRAVDGDARTDAAGGGKRSTALFLLTGYKQPPPAGPKVAPKAAEVVEDVDDPPAVAELPPKPLPQTMLPRNMTADALKPPLGAAQVAPPPRQLVDVDVCRGYYDVMGHFDTTFNCSKGSYIYCCGTCHYRFCCEHQRSRLDQESCNNYISPVWAEPLGPVTVSAGSKLDPDLEMLQQQNSSTAYVIGGVISFTLVVAVGVRIAFSKVARRPRNRDINMPRSLVDILRHQSSPVQQGERNNAALLAATTADGRTSKNHYTPILQSKDNRTGNLHHHFNQQGSASSPKHSATIERGARMNNTSQLSSGPALLSGSGKSSGGGGGSIIIGGGMRHNSSHPSFSHSFHNLAQLPPSYESAMKPEINRYSSLKRLEKELDEYSNYYNSKRRSNNAPPSFYSSQHYLPWGGDYTLGSSRGTLPLHGSRPRLHIPASTPNPYPLPAQTTHYTSSSFDRPPRRVRSQDQLLGEGNTLSRLSKNQQHQYYKAMMGSGSRGSNQQALRRSHERLLVSPDRLEDRLMMGLILGGGGLGGDRGDRGGGSGMVPTMGRLSHHQKAQSQQNICVTPSMERHHMIKMNSHPTPGHDYDRERSSGAMPGMGMQGGWDPHGGGGGGGHGGGGGGGGGGHPNARRMAFANKRQNTIEQLHFIPGGGGVQGLRTGSKNEVTV